MAMMPRLHWEFNNKIHCSRRIYGVLTSRVLIYADAIVIYKNMEQPYILSEEEQ